MSRKKNKNQNSPDKVNPDVAKLQHKIRRRNILFILLTLLCTIIGFVVIVIQIYLKEFTVLQDDVSVIVDTIAERYAERDKTSSGLFQHVFQKESSVLSQLMTDMNRDKTENNLSVDQASYLSLLKENSACKYLWLCDSNGTLLVSSYPYQPGDSLVRSGVLSAEAFTDLLENAVVMPSDLSSHTELLSDDISFLPIEGLGYFCSFIASETEEGTVSSCLIVGYSEETFSSGSNLAVDQALIANVGKLGDDLMSLYIIQASDNSIVYYSREPEEDGENLLFCSDADKTPITSWDEYLSGGWGYLFTNGNDEGKEAYYRVTDLPVLGRYVFIGAIDNITVEYTQDLAYCFPMCMTFLFLLMILLIIYGSYCSKRLSSSRLFTVMTIAVTLLISGIFTLLTYYGASISDLTDASNSASSAEELLETYTNQAMNRSDAIKEYYHQADARALSLIASDISYYGGKMDDTGVRRSYIAGDATGNYNTLKDSFGNDIICYAGSYPLQNKLSYLGASRMYLINDLGYAVASSSVEDWSFDVNTSKNCKELRDVLYRRSSSLYEYQTDDAGAYTGIWLACPVTLYAYSDGEGNTIYLTYEDYNNGKDSSTGRHLHNAKQLNGMVLAEIDGTPTAVTAVEESLITIERQICQIAGCSSALYNILPDDSASYLYSVNTEGTPVLKLQELLVPEKSKETARYNCFRTISQVDCYVRFIHDFEDNQYRALVFRNNDIHAERSWVTKTVGLDGLVLFSIVGLLILLFFRGPVQFREQLLGEDSDSQYSPVPDSREIPPGTYPNAEIFSVENVIPTSVGDAMSRLKTGSIGRTLADPGIIAMLIFQLVILLAGLFVIQEFISPDNSNYIIANIYSAEWEHCFNSYNVSAVIVIFVEIGILVSFITKIVQLFLVPLGVRAETYAKLLVSNFRYILLFVGLFYSAYLLGMEVKSLGTLATVIAGVITFGSQQLISDITSGLSMFTDGDYLIGDRVIVDGFEGTITEIGIRSSKLAGADGQTKSVANSHMSGAIRLKKTKAKEPPAQPPAPPEE